MTKSQRKDYSTDVLDCQGAINVGEVRGLGGLKNLQRLYQSIVDLA